MRMMKESTTKASGIQENVCCVVDFLPFSFADTIHFLMLRGCCFNFNTKVGTSRDKFGGCESGACIGSDEANRLGSAKEFGMSKPGFEGDDDRVGTFSW